MLALFAAFAGLHVTLLDISWWLVAAAFVVVALGAAVLARVWTRHPVLPTVAALVATVVGLTVGYAPDTALVGLIPTPATLGRFRELIDSGLLSIQEQRLPANPELGIVFIVAIFAAGTAILADLLVWTLRSPALVALPLLAVLVVPVAVRAGIADPVWFTVVAALYLGLLRSGRRSASGGVTLGVGVVVLLAALLAPSVLPKVVDDPGPVGGVGLAAGINPLINLGDDLRRGDPVTALQYTSDDGQGVYLRLATLADFSGRSWSPDPVVDDPTHTVDAFPPPDGLLPTVHQDSHSTTVNVADITGRWLPAPYPATSISGLQGTWMWDQQSLAVRSSDAGAGGQKYTVDFVGVKPTLAQLQVATPGVSQADPRYLALPKDVPYLFVQTALSVAGPAATDYDRALALQDYFRSGQFSYSEDAPVAGGFDGSGLDVMAAFLQAKTGYCVHFASAMAVMARILGIPSRIAVGFQPGAASSINGVRTFTVSSHDLHAWPELYFDGIGWLRFEPTPGRGVLPSYSDPTAVDDLATAPTTTASAPATAATAPAATSTGKPLADDPTGGVATPATAAASPVPLVLGIVLIVLLLAALSPAAARVIVRRLRRRRMRLGRDPATAAWAEVRDTARDHGWAAPDTETPRDFAERLGVVLVDDRAAVASLRASIEATAFGPPTRATISLEELDEVRRAISRSVDGRDRVRAVLLPASLLTRWRFDPSA